MAPKAKKMKATSSSPSMTALELLNSSNPAAAHQSTSTLREQFAATLPPSSSAAGNPSNMEPSSTIWKGKGVKNGVQEEEEEAIDSSGGEEEEGATTGKAQPSASPIAFSLSAAIAQSQASLRPTLDESMESIVMSGENDTIPTVPTTPTRVNPFSSPPRPSKSIEVITILSSPVKQLPPSSAVSPSKRTAAEIQANRLAAQEKFRAKQDEKNKNTELARSLSNARFATSQLQAFGVIPPSKGSTTYGTGKGGRKEPPKPGELVLEWKPDTACSVEQIQVLEQVRLGSNIFFTGSAGTGKSFLLKEITRLLEYLSRPYQVCATTGIAALQVGGATVHSWSGVGLGSESVMNLLDKLPKGKEKWKNWTETSTLIIDEISMISPTLFTKLSLLGKLIRERQGAFGGIQIIVCGDFYQLPPVPDKHPLCIRCGHEHFDTVKPEKSTLPQEIIPAGLTPYPIRQCTDSRRGGEIEKGCGFQFRDRKFAFETEAWSECQFKVMELTKVFRQSDSQYVAMLEKFRRGICDDSCVKLLATCGSALKGEVKIKPTNLYPIRSSVASENKSEFNKLPDKAYSFDALDSYHGPRAKALMLARLNDTPPEQKLFLKKGAQVMLTTNLDIEQGLVNGSRGVVVDWKLVSELPPVQGPVGASRRGGSFGGEEWREKASSEWQEEQEQQYLPEIFWACGVTRVIRPHTWVVDIDKTNSVARTQIPLVFAWALTIHKSQGQSLDAVGVKLSSTFEKGQAYVALSRSRTLAGMKVEGFLPSHIMAHPTVIRFYGRIGEKKPFFDSPSVNLNPLFFIPEYHPLLERLHRLFGGDSNSRPIGPPVSHPASRVTIALSSPEPEPEPARLVPFVKPIQQVPIPLPVPVLRVVPTPSFQFLLQQASLAFVSSGSREVAKFLEEAKKSFETVVGDDKMDIDQEDSKPLVGDTQDTSGGDQDAKKKTRKRSKRVGS